MVGGTYQVKPPFPFTPGLEAAGEIVVIGSSVKRLRWWQAGQLKPLVAKVFPLAEAGAALTALLLRSYAGKIVLAT